MQKYSLTHDDITDVILTHLHFDHTGGATEKNKNGEVIPTFKNATYYVQEKQFNWAISPSIRDQASYFNENYIPLKEKNVLELLQGEEEIVAIYILSQEGETGKSK